MSKLIILDVESYLYKASHACKELKEIKDFVYQEQYNLKTGIDFIDNTVKRLKNKLKAQDYGCMACEGDIHWCEVVEDNNKLEVIGNIYENKELLDE